MTSKMDNKINKVPIYCSVPAKESINSINKFLNDQKPFLNIIIFLIHVLLFKRIHGHAEYMLFSESVPGLYT